MYSVWENRRRVACRTPRASACREERGRCGAVSIMAEPAPSRRSVPKSVAAAICTFSRDSCGANCASRAMGAVISISERRAIVLRHSPTRLAPLALNIKSLLGWCVRLRASAFSREKLSISIKIAGREERSSASTDVPTLSPPARGS